MCFSQLLTENTQTKIVVLWQQWLLILHSYKCTGSSRKHCSVDNWYRSYWTKQSLYSAQWLKRDTRTTWWPAPSCATGGHWWHWDDAFLCHMKVRILLMHRNCIWPPKRSPVAQKAPATIPFEYRVSIAEQCTLISSTGKICHELNVDTSVVT